MTTFYSFARKIETSWAKKLIEPILETWNTANDVIHSLTIFFKNMQCKKIILNAQNLL